jgi:hypothetical protein
MKALLPWARVFVVLRCRFFWSFAGRAEGLSLLLNARHEAVHLSSLLCGESGETAVRQIAVERDVLQSHVLHLPHDAQGGREVVEGREPIA